MGAGSSAPYPEDSTLVVEHYVGCNAENGMVDGTGVARAGGGGREGGDWVGGEGIQSNTELGVLARRVVDTWSTAEFLIGGGAPSPAGRSSAGRRHPEATPPQVELPPWRRSSWPRVGRRSRHGERGSIGPDA